jgi:hypothetical protein
MSIVLKFRISIVFRWGNKDRICDQQWKNMLILKEGYESSEDYL